MAARGRSAVIGFLSFGLLTLALSAPASAQGIFESIFGGLRHTVEAPSQLPTNIHAFADPLTSLGNAINAPRVAIGPAKAFCVRTCDGRYFPVQPHAGVSAAESCRSFCPASQTRLYSGGTIDYAVANNGSHYADLDNAFIYRQRLVDGCTCNGRDPFGLARMDAKADPTLRPGDVVATKSGLLAFTGMKNKAADFTPVDSYRNFSKNQRDKLSDVKIMPPTPVAVGVKTATISLNADTASADRRRAQLER
jgi:hypothetical protein